MTGANQKLGEWGEGLAVDWYLREGYQVVERNWRVTEGEIDIIATTADRSVIVFCEVKTRTSTRFGSGAESVTPAKQRQVRKVALLWLRQCGANFDTIRFDVASVNGQGDVELLEGCF